jgi:hypothetical protein
VHVVQQEHAFAQGRQRLVGGLAIESSGRRPLEPVEHACLVAIRLQAAQEPGPGVAQALVVEVHGVLRREDDPDAEGPRLFQQRQERRFRRRCGDGREIAGDLVHVDDRPQAARPALAPHPADDLVQQQRDEEHAARVVQVRNRDDRHARPAGRPVQQPSGVERRPFEPLLEAGGREHRVQPGRQREALLGRIERIDVEDADLLKRRGLHRLDQRGEVHVAACLPAGRQQRREERVLAAAGLGIDIGQREHAHRRRRGALGQGLAVITNGLWRRRKRRQDRQRQTRATAWGVDGEVRRSPEALDARPVLAPVGEPLLPRGGLLRGVVVRRNAGAPCLLLVDPRPEVLGGEPWECQEEIRQVPLGIDRDRRHAVDRGFFDKGQAQAGFAAAGHADANRVGQQVARVVQDRLAGLPAGGIRPPPKVEDAELLKINHRTW